MNFSRYVVHSDYIQLNVHYCVLFSSRVRIRIGFSVWLVSCYAHVFVLLSVVIVTLPYITFTFVLLTSVNMIPRYLEATISAFHYGAVVT